MPLVSSSVRESVFLLPVLDRPGRLQGASCITSLPAVEELPAEASSVFAEAITTLQDLDMEFRQPCSQVPQLSISSGQFSQPALLFTGDLTNLAAASAAIDKDERLVASAAHTSAAGFAATSPECLQAAADEGWVLLERRENLGELHLQLPESLSVGAGIVTGPGHHTPRSLVASRLYKKSRGD